MNPFQLHYKANNESVPLKCIANSSLNSTLDFIWFVQAHQETQNGSQQKKIKVHSKRCRERRCFFFPGEVIKLVMFMLTTAAGYKWVEIKTN